MEIDVKFGYMTYTFYSNSDVEKAENIYANSKSFDELENELENLDIDFCYALVPIE